MTQTVARTRTTEEVFQSHREAIETLNIEQLMADYAEDCLFVTPDDSFIGREAILSGFFQAFMAQFPDAKINFDRVTIEGDICLVEWTSEASAMTVPVGLGVLFIQDGFIQRQVEWFQVELKE